MDGSGANCVWCGSFEFPVWAISSWPGKREVIHTGRGHEATGFASELEAHGELENGQVLERSI